VKPHDFIWLRDNIVLIFRWQGMEHFVPIHNFSTNPCSDWESFQTEDGKYYLVSANVKSRTSKLLQLVTYWN